MALTEKTFATGELAINYAERPGTRRAIVMLHGLTADWLGFRGLMMQLSAEWHAYACDLRGHGKSGRGAEYGLLDYERDLLAFLEKISGPAVLLGHSLGALIALLCAAQRPDLAQGLVLLDPPVYVRNAPVATHAGASGLFRWVYETMKDRPTFDQVVEACRLREPGADEARIQATALRESRVDPGTVGAALEDRMVDGADMDAALKRLRCPALILRGEWRYGACVRDEDALWFQALAPAARVVQIAGGTHGFLWERAEETGRLIGEFLQSLT
jgi:pimeloyl-ACP methyl ester carboxylesterase